MEINWELPESIKTQLAKLKEFEKKEAEEKMQKEKEERETKEREEAKQREAEEREQKEEREREKRKEAKEKEKTDALNAIKTVEPGSRKFMKLHRSTCAGGFPPDRLFWKQISDPSEFRFYGFWSRSRDGFSYACIRESFFGSWDWEVTTSSTVTKIPECARSVYTSMDGIKFKVIGFRDCGGYTYNENTHHPWTGKAETVTHHRDSYTIVVEIIGD
jgi:hypothetical protein